MPRPMGRWIALKIRRLPLSHKTNASYPINTDNDDTGDNVKHDDNLEGNDDKAMRVGWLSQ